MKYIAFKLILMMVFAGNCVSEEMRTWTHANGRSIAGNLVEFKDDVALIKFGNQEIKIKLQDLSQKDREYLLNLHRKKNRL